MENASRPLLVPLTLPTLAKLSTGDADPLENWNIVESSCAQTQATVLVSWGLSSRTESAEFRGAALGCEDGALYVFHPSMVARITPQILINSDPMSFADTDVVSSPPTPTKLPHSHSSRLRSRSASPSSLAFHQATFNMTSRSHVVSGISKEQVEAPKNYVDFEDEPEKLKEMLKGKGIRDKTSADSLLPYFEKGLVIEKSPHLPPLLPSGPVSKRKDDARSLLSATNSPSFTPRSPSTSSSPSLPSSDPSTYSLSLRFHIIPRRPGAVIVVQPLDNDRLLVMLQENGYGRYCMMTTHSSP